MPTRADPEGVERQLLSEMAKPVGLRVLEIGCGNGRMMWLYAAEAAHITGIDLNASALLMARDGCPKGANASPLFVRASAAGLPFVDRSFDLAIFAWSL